MQTPPNTDRDDLDQLISWALTTSVQDTQPSNTVWKRIVDHIANPEKVTHHTQHRQNNLPEWPVQPHVDLWLLKLQRG